MDRRIVFLAFAAVLAGASPALSEPAPATDDTLVIQVKDHDELTVKFCAANPDVEHIIVLPAALFVDSQQVIQRTVQALSNHRARRHGRF